MLDDIVAETNNHATKQYKKGFLIPAPLSYTSAQEFCKDHNITSRSLQKILSEHFTRHHHAITERSFADKLGFWMYNNLVTSTYVGGAVHKKFAQPIAQLTGVSTRRATKYNSLFGIVKNSTLIAGAHGLCSSIGVTDSTAGEVANGYLWARIGVSTAYDAFRSFVAKDHLPSLSSTALVSLSVDASARLWKTLPQNFRDDTNAFFDYLQGRPHLDKSYHRALNSLGESVASHTSQLKQGLVVPLISTISLIKSTGRQYL